jgi:predicted DNA-binding WGR domain protein
VTDPIIIRKRDQAQRMARFYRMAVQENLKLYPEGEGFDLVREWGRIGSPGLVRLDPFPSEADAWEAAGKLASAKRRKGYR